jgi:hypothetical protein
METAHVAGLQKHRKAFMAAVNPRVISTSWAYKKNLERG